MEIRNHYKFKNGSSINLIIEDGIIEKLINEYYKRKDICETCSKLELKLKLAIKIMRIKGVPL